MIPTWVIICIGIVIALQSVLIVCFYLPAHRYLTTQAEFDKYSNANLLSQGNVDVRWSGIATWGRRTAHVIVTQDRIMEFWNHKGRHIPLSLVKYANPPIPRKYQYWCSNMFNSSPELISIQTRPDGRRYLAVKVNSNPWMPLTKIRERRYFLDDVGKLEPQFG